MSPSPDFAHLQMAADPHDRAALRRTDDAWLAQRWADPESRVLVVSGTRIRPADGKVEWVSPADAPDGLRVLLGEWQGRAWFAVVTDAGLSRSGEGWLPLRGLLPALADDALAYAPLVFHALGLAEWLFVTRYCPRCAGELEPRRSGHELVCTQCGKPQFPRTDPAVIVLVAHGDKCLLGRQRAWPPGMHSTLAGFVEPGETLEEAVAREVLEESGVRVTNVEYKASQPWPNCSPTAQRSACRAMPCLRAEAGSIAPASKCLRPDGGLNLSLAIAAENGGHGQAYRSLPHAAPRPVGGRYRARADRRWLRPCAGPRRTGAAVLIA